VSLTRFMMTSVGLVEVQAHVLVDRLDARTWPRPRASSLQQEQTLAAAAMNRIAFPLRRIYSATTTSAIRM
jgi:hypothetical protein